MTEQSIVEKCPKCGGTGYENHGMLLNPTLPTKRSCRTCGGTGELTEPKQQEVFSREDMRKAFYAGESGDCAFNYFMEHRLKPSNTETKI